MNAVKKALAMAPASATLVLYVPPLVGPLVGPLVRALNHTAMNANRTRKDLKMTRTKRMRKLTTCVQVNSTT